MICHSNQVLRRARELDTFGQCVIRIGVSLMNPANLLLEQWDQAAQQYPNIRIEIVPFEDTEAAFSEVLDHLGETIDVISCPYETNYWGDRYQSFHLQDLPMCVACAKSHPLSAKDKLTVEDLYGQTLWIVERGVSDYQDRVRDDLEQNHPKIRLESGQHLNLAGFNRLVASRDLALSAQCWSGVHPLLATIPVDWEHSLPYGLIYAKEPTKEVMRFILAVGQKGKKHDH